MNRGDSSILLASGPLSQPSPFFVADPSPSSKFKASLACWLLQALSAVPQGSGAEISVSSQATKPAARPTLQPWVAMHSDENRRSGPARSPAFQGR